jgi:phosphohistidine phosphatase SixA
VILLVRHAFAGDRTAWSGDDHLRPLDERGLRQARELVDLLASYDVDRFISSPALRCVQTIEPSACERALSIEVREELSEERQAGDGAAFVRSLQGADVAVSCHGGLSEIVCGRTQKKGEVIVLDGERLVETFRARG